MIDFLKGKITPRDWMTVALFLGVTAALVASFYFMVHVKQREAIKLQIETNAKVQEDLNKARVIDREIEGYIAETDRIRDLVEQFESRLPSKRDLANLLRDFEDMADAENVKITTSPSRKKTQGSKETIPYKIQATGTYHQVARYINRLELFHRYLKISDLQMLPYEDGETTFKFTLNTYRFLQPTKPTESGDTK